MVLFFLTLRLCSLQGFLERAEGVPESIARHYLEAGRRLIITVPMEAERETHGLIVL